MIKEKVSHVTESNPERNRKSSKMKKSRSIKSEKVTKNLQYDRSLKQDYPPPHNLKVF